MRQTSFSCPKTDVHTSLTEQPLYPDFWVCSVQIKWGKFNSLFSHKPKKENLPISRNWIRTWTSCQLHFQMQELFLCYIHWWSKQNQQGGHHHWLCLRPVSVSRSDLGAWIMQWWFAVLITMMYSDCIQDVLVSSPKQLINVVAGPDKSLLTPKSAFCGPNHQTQSFQNTCIQISVVFTFEQRG